MDLPNLNAVRERVRSVQDLPASKRVPAIKAPRLGEIGAALVAVHFLDDEADSVRLAAIESLSAAAGGEAVSLARVGARAASQDEAPEVRSAARLVLASFPKPSDKNLRLPPATITGSATVRTQKSPSASGEPIAVWTRWYRSLSEVEQFALAKSSPTLELAAAILLDLERAGAASPIGMLHDVGANCSEAKTLALIGGRAMASAPNPIVRSLAVDCVGELGTLRDWPLLTRMLGDPSWFVRSSAVSFLDAIVGLAAVDQLVAVLVGDQNAATRAYASHGLARVMGAEAFAHLADALAREKDGLVRANIIDDLIGLGHWEFFDSAIQNIQRQSWLGRERTFALLTPRLAAANRPDESAKLCAAARWVLERDDSPAARHAAERALKTLESDPQIGG